MALTSTTYRVIFENMQDAVIILNETGTIEDCNSAARHLLFSNTDHKDQGSINMKDNPILSSLHHDIASFCSSEETEVIMEKSLPAPAGQRHFSVAFRKINDIGLEAPGLVLVSFRDTTHLVEALSQAQERFQSAFEGAAIGMALVAPDGHFLRVNKVFCQITGYSAEELLSLGSQDITCPEDLAKDQSLLHRLLSGEIDSYELEKRYIHKQGGLIWVLLSTSLVRDRSKNPAHVIVRQVQDITEKKQIEEKLRSSEEQSRALVESSSDPIIMIGTDKTLVACNQAFLDFFGFTREEIIGQSTRIMHPDDESHRLFGDRAYAVVDNGGTFRAEWSLSAKNGDIKLIESALSAIKGPSGETKGYVSIILDMSGRKNVENELRERMSDLQRLNKFMVDRELKMVELKARIKELESFNEKNK